MVIVIADDAGKTCVIYKDNFTGAAFRRIKSVRRDEPGSCAAVMDGSGRLAVNADQTLYDPIEQTKGRNFGTDADRAYRAYLMSKALFRVMDGVPFEVAIRRTDPVVYALKVAAITLAVMTALVFMSVQSKS